MSCQETQALLDGYVDGELDISRSLEVERHMQDCPACSHAYRSHQALRSAIRTSGLYFHPPAYLHKRVRAAVRRASGSHTTARVWGRRGLSVAASLAAVAILVWGLWPVLIGPSVDDRLAQELVAGHVRSLMASHLTDISSSDQHTVKPWFEGKLDFSPPVSDLTAQGFPLVGGRLDYLDNRPVAALVYQRQRHVINLFIWSSPYSPAAGEKTLTRQGYTLISWSISGVTYWAVSNLNMPELRAFVQAAQREAQKNPAPTSSPGSFTLPAKPAIQQSESRGDTR